MMHFSLYAFIPFFTFLGVAGLASAISFWIRYVPNIARRPTRPARTAKIISLPVKVAPDRRWSPALLLVKGGR